MVSIINFHKRSITPLNHLNTSWMPCKYHKQRYFSQIIRNMIRCYLGNVCSWYMKLDKMETHIFLLKIYYFFGKHATDFNDNLWHWKTVNKENWILGRLLALFFDKHFNKHYCKKQWTIQCNSILIFLYINIMCIKYAKLRFI